MPSRMYEYPLPRIVDEMQLNVPSGSIPRSVGVGSGNKPKIWVEVPQGAGGSTMVLNIRTILSYSPIPDNYKYIGSYSHSGSAYHVYGIEGAKEAAKAEVTHGEPVEKTTSRHRR